MISDLYLGMPKQEITTPALILDLDILEENLNRMASFFQGPVKLRPHIKTHKCPEIAERQIRAGAIGLTCAKLSESEVMEQHGLDDILIANQVVGCGKPERLALLAQRIDVTVAVDNQENIDDLDRVACLVGSQIGVVIEVNVGNDRCGTRTMEQTLALAKHIASKEGLILNGVMGYEGHCVFITNREERMAACMSANKVLVDAAEMLRSNGFGIEIVSAGGTGTYDMSGIYSGITEIQAGSYPFMDYRYSQVMGNEMFRPALWVLSTVISKPRSGLALIDAGAKCLTQDAGLPFPFLSGASLTGMSEEHGRLELQPEADGLQVGDLVEIWPSHACTTVNLYDRYCVLKDNKLEGIWPISCRGMSQ